MSETSRRVLAPGYMRGESWADTVILAREVEALESVLIGDFGVDPGDSAALLRLREAIDEHLPHYEPEHTNGDYAGVVRVAGRELTVTWEQETARLRERVRVLEEAQQWIAGVLDAILDAIRARDGGADLGKGE